MLLVNASPWGVVICSRTAEGISRAGKQAAAQAMDEGAGTRIVWMLLDLLRAFTPVFS